MINQRSNRNRKGDSKNMHFANTEGSSKIVWDYTESNNAYRMQKRNSFAVLTNTKDT